MGSVQWQTFPKSFAPSEIIRETVAVFSTAHTTIDSETKTLRSDDVLAEVRPGLLQLGFEVEAGKLRSEKITRPVLFGGGGAPERTFEADAFHAASGLVLEVEAGRGVTNYQFLKDLFQACMMQDAEHLMIAVRNKYRVSQDYAKVVSFFDTLYASGRLQLPLQTVTIVGY